MVLFILKIKIMGGVVRAETFQLFVWGVVIMTLLAVVLVVVALAKKRLYVGEGIALLVVALWVKLLGPIVVLLYLLGVKLLRKPKKAVIPNS
jgi:hypothetical protein